MAVVHCEGGSDVEVGDLWHDLDLECRIFLVLVVEVVHSVGSFLHVNMADFDVHKLVEMAATLKLRVMIHSHV